MINFNLIYARFIITIQQTVIKIISSVKYQQFTIGSSQRRKRIIYPQHILDSWAHSLVSLTENSRPPKVAYKNARLLPRERFHFHIFPCGHTHTRPLIYAHTRILTPPSARRYITLRRLYARSLSLSFDFFLFVLTSGSRALSPTHRPALRLTLVVSV